MITVEVEDGETHEIEADFFNLDAAGNLAVVALDRISQPGQAAQARIVRAYAKGTWRTASVGKVESSVIPFQKTPGVGRDYQPVLS